MSKIKLILAILVAILPLNILRVLGYRLLGYRIGQARIGFGTIIAVAEAQIAPARIGPFNIFLGPMKLVIHRGVSIGNRNEFACGAWVLRDEYRDSNYTRTLEIGEDALITSRHFFDVAGTISIGQRSWVAGVDSQFWTHGAGVLEREVKIGSDCYLGSAVRFAPGSSIGDRVIVAMGSVVSEKLNVDLALVGGVPARVVREGYDWRSKNAR